MANSHNVDVEEEVQPLPTIDWPTFEEEDDDGEVQFSPKDRVEKHGEHHSSVRRSQRDVRPNRKYLMPIYTNIKLAYCCSDVTTFFKKV